MKKIGILVALCLSFVIPGFAGVVDLAKSSGVTGGLVVHLNCGDGQETAALRLNERYVVQGLDVSDQNLQAVRKRLRAADLGGKVSVYKYDGRNLPYVDNLINLIVSSSKSQVSKAEILRVLAPRGVALVNGQKIVKPWPDGMDEWTHFLHSPDNNAVAQDSGIAAPRSMQWVSGPRWGRSHEELASMSAAVSAKGRIFFIVDKAPLAFIRFSGQWDLIARDAFNGTFLWQKKIPLWTDHLRHFRAGPVQLPRRLVAVGDKVFVTLGLSAPVTALDAATGEILHTYKGTESTEEILVDGGVLYLTAGTSEIDRKGGGLHERGEPAPTGFRNIAALNIETGKEMWRKSSSDGAHILPLSMVVGEGSVFYQSTSGVVCLDAKSGDQVWKSERQSLAKRMSFSAPTAVVAGDILLVADRVATDKDASTGKVEWGVHGWTEAGFSRKGKSLLIAYNIKDGEKLWEVPCTEGYNAEVDIFVIGDMVWVGSNFKGYDLKTGELKKELAWKGDRVAMAHHRCYRDKATENFILTGRSGIEMVDLEKGWEGNNSWIRGTCQYGIMPSNGLLYAPPDACACYPKVKLQGFVAIAPQRGKDGHLPFPKKPVLEKGPAFGKISSASLSRNDWPTFRHDASRSGNASTRVPAKVAKKWTVDIGGKLTQPVIAGGKIFLASTDTHTVYALGAGNGKEVWTYTAGGRVDSSPTIYKGMALFGSCDGWVYALRASDGQLAWRFRAAPQERFVGVYNQLESLWPVHGAVLVQNDTLYVTAGRSTYLDGGIILYLLNPATGEEISRTVTYDLDPDTSKQKAPEYTNGFDMPGSASDILSGDGDSVFMKQLHFTASGQPCEEEKAHLFCLSGFLGEEWFVRSYWIIGTEFGGGWGRWADAAKVVPSGRILAFDDDKVVGYGRREVAGGAAGHTLDKYHFFSKSKILRSTKPPSRKPKAPKNGPKPTPAPKLPVSETYWTNENSIMVRAMLLTPDKVVVAGPPELGEREEALLAFKNEAEALAAFNGERGVTLQIMSASDGAKLSEVDLDALPVFDGMSAAQGNLYLSLKNGTVQCWGE